MSLDELKSLKRGDRVFCRLDKVVAVAKVNAIDEQSVELFWHDGTSSLIWFKHCIDGRDNRYPLLFRGKPA